MNLVHNESNQAVPPPYSPSVPATQNHHHASRNNCSDPTNEPPSTSSNITDSSSNKQDEGKNRSNKAQKEFYL